MAYCKIPNKKVWTKSNTAIHGPLGFVFYPFNKTDIISDGLENQFTAHDLCDCDNRRQVMVKVEALLATVDEDS
jgi:hypothetical protein